MWRVATGLTAETQSTPMVAESSAGQQARVETGARIPGVGLLG